MVGVSPLKIRYVLETESGKGHTSFNPSITLIIYICIIPVYARTPHGNAAIRLAQQHARILAILISSPLTADPLISRLVCINPLLSRSLDGD